MRTVLLLIFFAGCGLSQILSGVLSAGGNAPTQVATPTFSPTSGAGACSGSCTITVSDTDSGLSGYAATYCTNASTDCTPGTSYTAPVSFSTSGTHLCAFANATGKVQSATRCDTYTVTATHTYTIQTKTAAVQTASGVSTTCTFSPAAQSGDLIVAFGAAGTVNSGASALSVSDDKSGGSSVYSIAVNDTTNLAGYGNFKVFYTWGAAAGISVVTLSSDQFTAIAGVCYLIHDSAGPFTADPLDVTPTISTSFTASNSYTLPSLTPSQSDGVIVALVNDAGGVATGWTNSVSWTTAGSTTSGWPVFSQYLANASVAAYAPVVTTTGSGSFKYHGAMVAFKHP